ncbi:LON peptidase substrate-binding domain-containing protein [Oceanibacterium hippocampi]|uniref:Lon protease 2 n=1 Tax=Oceanibacterium hippocampi TaxID=745714 RepID=A0A1Y5RF21_9PROT|nr:LON peptidase substrate-binding domain-containing protein [Oceanibacterium hippocampi]SLN15987.1 Lon protease 2 [Oceanibacterium hippocampi]
MSAGGQTSGLDDLPRILPLFPLEGALLLPRGRLPLHIFEPRYRAMTQSAVAAAGMIGMIQPRAGDASGAAPALYGVGCAGKISDLTETPDGRYYFTLDGLCRFEIEEELESSEPFRTARVSYKRYLGDLSGETGGEPIRDALVQALRAYLDLRAIPADWQAIERMEPALLVNTLAMICPFAPNEKQALLEAPEVRARAELMVTLMEMAVLAANRQGGAIQ